MRKWLKRSASFFLIPLTRWYLKRPRKYNYRGIKIQVLPGVFHPGLFSSTKFLLEFLQEQKLKDTTLLELGCGTGLISIVAARAASKVTACDLSLIAIGNANHNFKKNHVNVECIHSDLFDSLPKRTFDWIIINPPYYARPIQKEAELAWHCGEEFQYFKKLFSTLQEHIHERSQIIMVLTLGCELEKIFKIAETHHFTFELLKDKDVLFDGKDFLFGIKSIQF